MTTNKYVPSEDEMISGLVQIPGEPAGIYRHVRVDEMKRGLARVRREALNGLAEWYQETADLFDEHSGSPEGRARRDESLNRKAETLAYRDTFHPEEAHGR